MTHFCSLNPHPAVGSKRFQSWPPKLAPSTRVLIVPGLGDSGPSHWQTWLQRQYRDSARVIQRNWQEPDLSAWADCIKAALEKDRNSSWVAVAHSFGCLALAHHIHRSNSTGADHRIAHALMVAPANPKKFGLKSTDLGEQGLGVSSTLIASEDDPWMSLNEALDWGRRWGGRCLNLGAVGHINAESGFNVWPFARHLVDQQIRHRQRLSRIERAHPLELNFAV